MSKKNINTSKELIDKFVNPNKSWQTHKLKEIDIAEVILNLLKKDFVVEIDGYKYDITFGINKDNEIGQTIILKDSPSLCSFEIINLGFKKGIWYEILDEELSEDEQNKIKKEIEKYKEKEVYDFISELVKKTKLN